MATISPFRALRPTPESAAHVAAVPYDVVNTEEARALADGQPLSFLHVSRAEIDLASCETWNAEIGPGPVTMLRMLVVIARGCCCAGGRGGPDEGPSVTHARENSVN